MTIIVKQNRFTRKQGDNVRLIDCQTFDEKQSVCSSNVTTQGIADSDLRMYAWGDWGKFKDNMVKSGHTIEIME